MSDPVQIDVTLDGMSCAACAGRAERALRAVAGVAQATVNFATGRARIELSPDAAPDALADAFAALTRAGYPAQTGETRLLIDGMSCAACSGRVERALARLPGVFGSEVNFATGQAVVRHGPQVTAEFLAAAVSKAGYEARLPAGDDAARPRADDHGAAGTLRRRFAVALILTLPLFLVEMGGHLIPAFHHWLAAAIDQRLLWMAEFALTCMVLAGPGRVFFMTGIPALLRGAPEMNSLVALGSGAAFLYSAVSTFAPQLLPQGAAHVYYEAAAVIVTLILLGRWLEARARGQAGEAIRRLVELAPDTARIERDGRIVTLPVAEIRTGDLLHLAAGERVAVDGRVVEGVGRIDESMLTGEPVPVAKHPGDAVTAGTVNGAGALTVAVTATGEDTALARIVRMVEDAQTAKLPVQALVDRVTRVFVPVVIALSVLTFLLWVSFGPAPRFGPALVAAISVLIIACPCAMGLAVPMSIMVGTGRGAELGILFRRGDALQRLADARNVGFDKTGTLTQGKPSLVAMETRGIERAALLSLTAAAETRSTHPLAQAIVAAAGEGQLPAAEAVRETAGQGLQATVNGQRLVIGNGAALAGAGIAADPDLTAQADAMARDGATPVHVAVDGVHRGVLALADPPRDGAAEAVAALSDLGLTTLMISGDVPRTAEAVARRLGVSRVIAGVLPEGKLAAIRDLGPGSVFVGDGINDAPALAAAETGIAIGTGTDVAIEAAEVVLASGDPRGVARAIALSRAVMRNIRQNLFWAFGYNVALIPVAMGALVPFGGPQLSPMLGAGAMALSSVFVVSNALRLRSWKP